MHTIEHSESILTVFPHCSLWNTYYILIYLMKKMHRGGREWDRRRQRRIQHREENEMKEMNKCIQFGIVFDCVALVIPIFVLYSFISWIFFFFLFWFWFSFFLNFVHWFWLRIGSGCCTILPWIWFEMFVICTQSQAFSRSHS